MHYCGVLLHVVANHIGASRCVGLRFCFCITKVVMFVVCSVLFTMCFNMKQNWFPNSGPHFLVLYWLYVGRGTWFLAPDFAQLVSKGTWVPQVPQGSPVLLGVPSSS